MASAAAGGAESSDASVDEGIGVVRGGGGAAVQRKTWVQWEDERLVDYVATNRILSFTTVRRRAHRLVRAIIRDCVYPVCCARPPVRLFVRTARRARARARTCAALHTWP